MVPLIFAVIGLMIGWFRAQKAGKVVLDRLQYSVAHGIGFGLIGLIASVIYIRMSM